MNSQRVQVPVTFTRTQKLCTQEAEEDEAESSEEEYEEESLFEMSVYMSEVSSSSEDEDIEFNPWTQETSPAYTKDNNKENEFEEHMPYEEHPAYYLAEAETSEPSSFKKQNMGPLEYHQHQQLQGILHEFADIVANSQTKIRRTNIISHRIDTGDAIPIAQKPYRTNPANASFVKTEIQRMLDNKIIRPSHSPWSSPVVVVGKKDGEKRLCIDFRKLNKVTKVDAYPLPRIDDLLDSLGGANWFTTLDLASGYWQVAMHEADIEKTAFITPSGLYEFLVMPFGLNNAPGTFQRLINWVLRDFLGIFVAVYLDDVIIYTKGAYEPHLDHIRQVFSVLRKSNLKIKLKKCHFCLLSLAFLGHIVG